MFDINFDVTSQIISLTASIVAMGSTLYFWLVRANRERPDLAIETLTKLKGRVLLPQEHPDAFRALRPNDDEVVAAYWIDVAVINNSLLPNAVLATTAEIKMASGKWKPVNVRVVSETPFPINVSPLTTAGVSLEFTASISGDLSQSTGQQRVEMAQSAIKTGNPIRLQLKGVRNVSFEFLLSDKLQDQEDFPLKVVSGGDDSVDQRRAA